MRTSTVQPPLGTPVNMNHSLSKGLVGCWLMNEGGGRKAFDSTKVTIIPGALTGTTITYKQGTLGNSMSTTGAASNYIDLGAPSNLDIIAAYSISMWVNPASLSNFQNTFFKGTNTQVQFGLIIPATGVWIAQANTGPNNVNGGTVTVGKWFHIAATYDGSILKTYQNGVFQNQSTSFVLTRGGTTTTISGDSFNARYFNGLITDVKFYSRALLANEVRLLYYQPYSMFVGYKGLKK